MKKIDLSGIEPFLEKLGKLSRIQRILISCGIIALFFGMFFYFFFLPKHKEINKLEDQIAKLDKKLTVAKRNAKDLKKFQKKMKDAEIQFKLVMKSLPEKREIPALLANVSMSGQDAGLEFQLFQPQRERPRNFYAEIPVAIRVTGNYHNTAKFFDEVARLARIVNIQNIVMKPVKGGANIATSCTAVTYKFMEAPPPSKKKKKGTRKRKPRKKKKK